MKTIVSEIDKINHAAAEHIAELLKRKPDAVIALTAGRTTSGLYEVLSDMCRRGEMSFRAAHILAVTELMDAPSEDTHRVLLEKQLIGNIDIIPENVHYPDPDAPAEYDALIESLNGLDLAVLGIGMDCHVGYNEPATPFDSRTHVQKLTDRTKRQLTAVGVTPDRIYDYAVTMGIKTLTEARDIMLMAFGSEKADSVHLMLYGKTMSYIPASFLQIPLNVTVYLDNDAAANI